jgi:hypothetical protein
MVDAAANGSANAPTADAGMDGYAGDAGDAALDGGDAD